MFWRLLISLGSLAFIYLIGAPVYEILQLSSEITAASANSTPPAPQTPTAAQLALLVFYGCAYLLLLCLIWSGD